MPGRIDGKVAFITGAARGQGRSHAIRLAQEGADIIAVDICAPVDGVMYPMPGPADLAETVKEVEALDRRIVAVQADVRDFDALKAAVDDGVGQLGRLDIVVANAGIGALGASLAKMSLKTWQDTIDINLTGVWLTAKAAIPHLIAGGRGGSIVLTSSVGAVKGMEGAGHYVAAKHGVVGLMRTLALEMAHHKIRVNTIMPTQVNTPMAVNEGTFRLFRPDLENPTIDDFAVASAMTNPLQVPWMEPLDISNAVLFLASEESRYITGVMLPVDAGSLLK
jgi:(+)-trans-carveol dehydrogenase